jgi:hypothetical protein
MITTANIVLTFKTLWDADATLTASVPGGLCFGRQLDTSSSPYATILVQSQGKVIDTGDNFLEDFLVTIRVYGAVTLTVMDTISQRISTLFDSKSTLGSLSEFVMMYPTADSIEEDISEKEAKDIVFAVHSWNLKTQVVR